MKRITWADFGVTGCKGWVRNLEQKKFCSQAFFTLEEPRVLTWEHCTVMMSIGDIFKESEIPRAEIAGCHVVPHGHLCNSRKLPDCLLPRPGRLLVCTSTRNPKCLFTASTRHSFCSLLSQASKPCDSPWKCSKLEFLRIHGWHRIWFNHWILKLTPIQEHGMILDDRHHSRRIWDVLLCRVRGPEDTSQDVPPQTDEFWFRFKTFQRHEIPLVTNTSGDESWIIASAVQFCNSSWVKCCDTCDISCLKWTDDSLTQGASSTRSWLLWRETSQDLNGRWLWSHTSPGHELHFGPADLVHLSIRSFEFHLARLFYLKVRQKKIMTYTTSDCQPSRCFARSLERNCRKCIQRVLHPES